MSNATGSPRDAASVLFDLPGYHVETGVDLPDGGREVVVAAVAGEAACPDCGVLSVRVHQRTRQRLRDVPLAGRVEVVLVKQRFRALTPDPVHGVGYAAVGSVAGWARAYVVS